MESIVIFDNFKDTDFKPEALLNKYKKLLAEDVKRIFVKEGNLKKRPCPACGSEKALKAFEKNALEYKECGVCHTLYISPSPSEKSLNDFYRNSKSRIFWREEISRKTSQKRIEKIINPRIRWIRDSVSEYLPDAHSYADINTKQYEYPEKLDKEKLFKETFFLDPYMDISKADTAKNFRTGSLSEMEKNKIQLISIFEVCDHKNDIDAFFSGLNKALIKKGLVFMTAILSSGFDLQILWDKSDNIFPLDRLNIFSIEGLQNLFKRHNFECLEMSTPGILDIENIEKVLKADSSVKAPRFIKYLLENRNEEIKRSFQEFLQASLLSSYGRILLRKK